MPELDRDEMRRLHPYSLLFRVFGAINTFFLPAVLVWFFSSEDHRWEALIAVFFIPVLIANILQYITLRYLFVGDELVVRRGLLFRSERHIPFERIENVDLTRNPVHRWLNVAIVRLDTASGDEAEAVFRVLGMDAVTELLEEIQSRAASGSAAVDAARHLREMLQESEGPAAASDARGEEAQPAQLTKRLASLGIGDLVRLGLISNRGLLGLAAAIGIAWRFDATEQWIRESFIGTLIDFMTGGAGVMNALLAVLIVVPVIMVLSVIWTLLRYYGYALERDGSLFRWSAGSWTHVTASIPERRVQKLTIRQTPLHRIFRRAAIRIETIGGGEEDDPVAGRVDFIPLCRIADAPSLAARAMPKLEFPTSYERLHPRTGRRRVRAALLASPLVALIAILVLGLTWGIVVAVAVLAFSVLSGIYDARWSGFSSSERGIFVRRGWLGRKWICVPMDKVQVVELSASPFDRRWGMAQLFVDNAGARSFDLLEIECVEAERAHALYAEWSKLAASREFAV